MVDLSSGRCDAPRHHFLGVLAARPQTLLQGLAVRRQDEHAYHVLAHPLLELAGPLPIDIEEHVIARVERGLHGCLRRRIAIAVNLGPLEQLAGPLEPLELGRVDEVVVPTVHLSAPRLARRHGHRHAQAGVGCQQPPCQRGLARARWRGQHQQQAAPRDARHHPFAALLWARLTQGFRSLDVLYLLAHLVDDCLELEARPRRLRIARLGAQRVGLAIELLGEKIQSPSRRLAR